MCPVLFLPSISSQSLPVKHGLFILARRVAIDALGTCTSRPPALNNERMAVLIRAPKRVRLSLEIDPKGGSAGVVGGTVRAVDGGVEAAGHRARIKDKGLVEDIQTDGRLG